MLPEESRKVSIYQPAPSKIRFTSQLPTLFLINKESHDEVIRALGSNVLSLQSRRTYFNFYKDTLHLQESCTVAMNYTDFIEARIAGLSVIFGTRQMERITSLTTDLPRNVWLSDNDPSGLLSELCQFKGLKILVLAISSFGLHRVNCAVQNKIERDFGYIFVAARKQQPDWKQPNLVVRIS